MIFNISKVTEKYINIFGEEISDRPANTVSDTSAQQETFRVM